MSDRIKPERSNLTEDDVKKMLRAYGDLETELEIMRAETDARIKPIQEALEGASKELINELSTYKDKLHQYVREHESEFKDKKKSKTIELGNMAVGKIGLRKIGFSIRIDKDEAVRALTISAIRTHKIRDVLQVKTSIILSNLKKYMRQHPKVNLPGVTRVPSCNEPFIEVKRNPDAGKK